MLIPYIGITDFMKFEDVEDMLRIFRKHKPEASPRKLHVGVMTSRKKLLGIPTKYRDAFPNMDSIADIFRSDEAFDCLHYADSEADPDLYKNLAAAIGYGGIGIHAVQLDLAWPDPGFVAEAVHRSRKNLEVILQIGRKAFEAIDNDPKKLIERLED